MYSFKFNSFFKFLSKNKAYTAVNVLGMSISITFVILISLYTERELTIDREQENRDRLVVIANEDLLMTAVPVAYWLEERYPEIEKVCPAIFGMEDGHRTIFRNNAFFADLAFVDSTFFELFSFDLIAGDRSKCLEGEYDAVISESFARKVFGKEEALGKQLNISDATSVTVTGVMRDIDRSVIPDADILLRIERVTEFNRTISKTTQNNAGACIAFILLKPGADLKNRTDDILSFFKERFWLYRENFKKEVRVVPFSEIYFYKSEKGGLNGGDKRFVFVLFSVGMLILIFSIINYINLTAAQSGRRAKEMAMRGLLGSSRNELMLRLITESTLLTFVSFAIGLLLVYIAIPYANTILQTGISFESLLTFPWIAGLISAVLIIGFLSGLFPATVISSVKPIDIVRGTLRRKTKMVLSKVFIIFQNAVTIAMIAASLTMILQINHILNAPLGYNTKNIIEVDNIFNSRNEMSQAENLLRQLPCVKAVGHSNGSPAGGTNNLSGTYEDKALSFQQMTVDSAAFRIWGLHIKQENNMVSSSDGWYLNELAFKKMELSEDAASFRIYDTRTPVLGVLDDFQLWNITRENSPLMLRFRNSSNNWFWTYIIEVQGNPVEAFEAVKNVFEQVSGTFNGQYTEDRIRANFEAQIRLSKIVIIFTGIAILISLLGMIAMSTYFIGQKVTEMTIRKIFGSDNAAILKRLIGTFVSYVGIAFVFATPVAWYFMNKWLSEFSYRIELTPLIFLSAGFLCFLIAFLSVFFQSRKAANTNPVINLKNE